MKIKSNNNILILTFIAFLCLIIESKFFKPDLLVSIKTNQFNSIQIEAYKSHNTLSISKLNKNEIAWVSLGSPTFISILKSNDSINEIFKFSSDYFYTFIEMLTETHISLLKDAIKYKYGYEIEADCQISNMPLSRFVCTALLFDEETNETLSVNGKVKNFFNYPLKLQFEYNKNSKERLMFEKRLNKRDDEISFECEIISKDLFESNHIFELKSEEILNKFDLFKKSNDTLINKYQLELLVDNIYKDFDVKKRYNISKSLFIDEFIKQISNESFTFMDFDQSIINLSGYGINIEKNFRENLFDLFEIQIENDKIRINIDNRKFQGIDNVLGFDIKNILDFIEIHKNEWFNLTEIFINKTITEINCLKDGEIEWHLIKDKILPKSIKVLKLNKNRLTNTFIFNQTDHMKKEIEIVKFKQNLTISTITNIKVSLNSELELQFQNLTKYLSEINLNLTSIQNELTILKLNSTKNMEEIIKLQESIQCKEDKRIIFQNENRNPTNCYELFMFNSNSVCLKSGIYNIYPGKKN
jgi:hypothetical protein